MLKERLRLPSRETERDLQRARESLRPMHGGSDSPASPRSTSWFDGEKTRGVFLPGLSEPDGDYYLPPPHRTPVMTDVEFMETLKTKSLRRRQLQ